MTIAEGRRFRNYPRRKAGWLDWQTGMGVDHMGARWKIRKRSAVSNLVAAAQSRELDQVVLCGELPGLVRDQLRQWAYCQKGEGPRALRPGWSHGRHYWPDSGAPVLRYEGPAGPLEVYLAESWFGDELGRHITPAAGRDALERVRVELAGRARGCPLLSTPVATGLAAADRLIDCDREPWPAEYRDLIRSWAGQHRMEWLARGRQLGQVVELDMRLAYGGLCWGLGAGGPVHLRGFDERRPAALYGLWATVPTDWAREGVLPAKKASGGWEWPAEPGRRFFTYCTGAEVNVALKAGWELDVRDGWAAADPKGKPLDRWAQELVGMADLFRLAGDTLAYAASRSIVLQGIGGFVARPARVYRVVPYSELDTIPRSDTVVPGSVRRVGDSITWAETVPAARGDLEHPEWAANVWGRCRARLLWKADGSGTLHYRPELVAGYRGDAVYLTDVPAGWPVGGARAGSWQEKHRHAGPLNFPGLPAFDRYRNSQEVPANV